MTPDLRPVLDFIIAKKIDEPAGPAGQIVLVNPMPNAPEFFEVLAVGPGRWEAGVLVKPPAKVGDRVMTHANPGTKFRLQGIDLIWLAPGNLVAVLGNGLVPLEEMRSL